MTISDIEYRPIRDFPEYQIGANKAVWSIPRQRPGKGGSVRTIPGVQLKPDDRQRVWLNRAGEPAERQSVDTLWHNHFPELAHPKPQARCRKGHPLLPGEGVQPNIARWGCGNRVCLDCHPDWTPPAKTVRTSPRTRGPGRFAVTLDREDVRLVFPRVVLVPEHLRELDALMRERP